MPAQGPEIAVKISAKADQFSASIAQIKKDLAGLPQIANQASKKFGASGGGFSLSGINRRVGEDLRRAYGGFSGSARAASSMARGLPGFGPLAGAASIAGIGDLLTQQAAGGIHLRNTALAAGMTPEKLNSLRAAARSMGFSAGDADQSVVSLGRTLQDAAFGRDAGAANGFRALGISFGDAKNGARPLEAVLGDLQDRLAKLGKKNPGAAMHALDLIHQSSAMLPFFMNGRQAIDKYRASIERTWGSMGNYIRESERFTQSTANLTNASSRLGMTIFDKLEPHLSPMIDKLSNFVDTHDKDIGEVFDRIGLAIQGVDWNKVGQDVEQVGNTIARVTGRMDDFGNRIDRVTSRVSHFMDVIRAPGRAYRGEDQGPEMDLPIGSPGWRTFQRYAPRPSGPMGGFENGVPPAPPRVSTYDTNIDPRAQGLLDTIAGTESRGRYDVMYGGGHMANYGPGPAPEHVIQRGPHKGELTSAFGRYQFENGTWDQAAAALGLTDKTPRSQDRAAWWLAQRDYQRRTGGNLSTDLQSTDPAVRAGIGRALRGTWTSLPGGIETGTNDSRFGRQLDANIGREERASRIPGSTPGTPPRLPELMTPGPSASNDAQPGSTHKITIDLNGAPHGATVRLDSRGEGAEIAGVRIGRSMPDAGNMGPNNPFGGH